MAWGMAVRERCRKVIIVKLAEEFEQHTGLRHSQNIGGVVK
jgi:hypothetical protein